MRADRFGYEWEKYSDIKPQYYASYQRQFLNWIYPLQPDYFIDKKILDAGCGMGRNSYWALVWGAREVYAFDHDERSVAAAKNTLKDFANAHVSLHDLEHLPWVDEFDFIFSIGVIHHTKNPHLVMGQLHKSLKPGGEILLWVYSREGFEWIVKILNPLRINITSRMSPRLLHLLTYIVSVPFYFYLKIFNPQRPYFQQLRSFSFTHVQSILFDQLLPDIARYYSKEEAQELLQGFRHVEVYAPPNRTGWIVRGTK